MVAKGPPQLVPSAHSLTIVQRNQQQSPLLQLPAELRTLIYEFTMDLNTGRILHDDRYDWDRLEFARVSRQVFAETAQVYFERKLLPLSSDKGVACKDPEQWELLINQLTLAQKKRIKLMVLPFRIVHWIIRVKTWSDYWIEPNFPALGVYCRTFRRQSDAEVKLLTRAIQALRTHVPVLLINEDEVFEMS